MIEGGSEVRLQQLLAELGYIPLEFLPALPSSTDPTTTSTTVPVSVHQPQQVVDAMEVEVERLRAHISHFQLGATVK